jgi:hypothetical protein
MTPDWLDTFPTCTVTGTALPRGMPTGICTLICISPATSPGAPRGGGFGNGAGFSRRARTMAKRALEVAAAGSHNVLRFGPISLRRLDSRCNVAKSESRSPNEPTQRHTCHGLRHWIVTLERFLRIVNPCLAEAGGKIRQVIADS